MSLDLGEPQTTIMSSEVLVELGWNIKAGVDEKLDVDFQAFMLNSQNKVRSSNDLIFYGKLTSDCRSVIHMGKNKLGKGNDRKEQIKVELQKVPEDIQKIVLIATIYGLKNEEKYFGQVSNAYINLYENDGTDKIAEFAITENCSTAVSIIIGEISRDTEKWNFSVECEGRPESLEELAVMYGISLV